MNPELNLQRCEEEKIHIPDLIQPFGYLLALSPKDFSVTRCSENLPSLLNKSIEDILKSHPQEFFSESIMNLIYNSTNFQTKKRSILSLNQTIGEIKDQGFDFILSSGNEEIILEIIPSLSNSEETISIEAQFNEIIRKIVTTSDTNELFSLVVNEIKEIMGYHRVMIYRFDRDYNGEVISEAKESNLVSYLNLHYPASDVPAQARDLYLKNMIRLIQNVHYSPVKIQSRDKGSESLDMSYCGLRSVSPIHLEYLVNMGVIATLTISLIVNQKLWGLISCHHSTPYLPDNRKLNYMEVFGNILGGIIQMREESEVDKKNAEQLARLDTIMNILLSQKKDSELHDIISNKLFLFKMLYQSDGFVFFSEDYFIIQSSDLNRSEVQSIIQEYNSQIHSEFFITDHLSESLPGLTEEIYRKCAGLLIIRINSHPSTYWIWHRKEIKLTISWGGNPNEKASINPLGRISPRKSFEKFNQTVSMKSLPWNSSEKNLHKYLIPQLYRLFDYFESLKELNIHKNQILDLKEEKTKHYNKLIEMLVDVIEKRDSYTAGHTKRVSIYCEMIAYKMNFDIEQISRLKEAAILHDIGKVIIPDSILLKPGKLSQKEYELIKLHLKVGYEILDKIDYYKPLANIIKYHHEKMDGSGYPYGVRGDEIPILSHVMIVADALDAMTTNRIYQSRKTFEEAIEELNRYKSIWYHPDVVDAATAAISSVPIRTENTSQLPFTEIEIERFSYFFKDRLTGVYNETYLWMILKGMIPDLSYKKFYLVELNGMSEYNSRFGWKKGNSIIQKFAGDLSKLVKEEQLFRVFGDDFVICFENESEEIFPNDEWKHLNHEGILCNCRKVEKELFWEIV